jgi:hypothetical protein
LGFAWIAESLMKVVIVKRSSIGREDSMGQSGIRPIDPVECAFVMNTIKKLMHLWIAVG